MVDLFSHGKQFTFSAGLFSRLLAVALFSTLGPKHIRVLVMRKDVWRLKDLRIDHCLTVLIQRLWLATNYSSADVGVATCGGRGKSCGKT